MSYIRNSITFVFILLMLVSCALTTTHYNNFTPAPTHSLRVASYNVFWLNGYCKGPTPDAATKIIKVMNADILLLQETTPAWQTCLKKHFSSIYPFRKYQHHTDEGGLAILSRYPIKTIHYLKLDSLRYPAWVVLIKSKLGPIQIVNIHLHPPLTKDNKLGFLAQGYFSSKIKRLREIKNILHYVNPHLPTIIAGDFNENDYGLAIQYLKKQHYLDALSYNKTYTHTWYWSIGPFHLTGRYDHLFFTHAINLINVQVLHEGVSDHYPIVSDLTLK